MNDIFDKRKTELETAYSLATAELAAVGRQIEALTGRREALIRTQQRIQDSAGELETIRKRFAVPDESRLKLTERLEK